MIYVASSDGFSNIIKMSVNKAFETQSQNNLEKPVMCVCVCVLPYFISNFLKKYRRYEAYFINLRQPEPGLQNHL